MIVLQGKSIDHLKIKPTHNIYIKFCAAVELCLEEIYSHICYYLKTVNESKLVWYSIQEVGI